MGEWERGSGEFVCSAFCVAQIATSMIEHRAHMTMNSMRLHESTMSQSQTAIIAALSSDRIYVRDLSSSHRYSPLDDDECDRGSADVAHEVGVACYVAAIRGVQLHDSPVSCNAHQAICNQCKRAGRVRSSRRNEAGGNCRVTVNRRDWSVCRGNAKWTMMRRCESERNERNVWQSLEIR